jgi:hypothetical protein
MSAGQALHYLGLEGSINANGCVTAGVWQVRGAWRRRRPGRPPPTTML